MSGRVAGPEKRCPHCGETKPRSAFGKGNGGKEGQAGRCKPCAIAVTRAWALANADRIAAKREQQRQALAAERAQRPCKQPGCTALRANEGWARFCVAHHADTQAAIRRAFRNLERQARVDALARRLALKEAEKAERQARINALLARRQERQAARREAREELREKRSSRRGELRKDVCKWGHSLDDALTVLERRRGGLAYRRCRTCNNEQQARRLGRAA